MGDGADLCLVAVFRIDASLLGPSGPFLFYDLTPPFCKDRTLHVVLFAASAAGLRELTECIGCLVSPFRTQHDEYDAVPSKRGTARIHDCSRRSARIYACTV